MTKYICRCGAINSQFARSCHLCGSLVESMQDTTITGTSISQFLSKEIKTDKISAVIKASEDLLNNYEKCPQNPHNNPTVRWKYIDALRDAVKSLKDKS